MILQLSDKCQHYIIIQMAYRKYLKPDPFEASRRNIQLKLHHIEESILFKFAQGKQRQLMRKTIRQLLQKQQSTQAKIKKLIALVDSFEPVQLRTTYTDQPEEEEEDYSFQKYERENLYYSAKNRESPAHKNSHSQLSRYSRDLKTSFQGKKFYTQNEQQHSKCSQSLLQSHNTPFSLLSSYKNYSDILQYHDDGQKRQASDLKLIDSINEKDIFSFRTQKGQQFPSSSAKNAKENVSPSNGKGAKKEENSRSKSPKKQIAYSEKSSKSRSQKSKSKKKTNYDGFSFTYQPSKTLSSLHKSQSRSVKSPSKQAPPINPALLYKKISNRIKLSSCVIDRLSHSTSSASHFHLSNRFKHQLQARCELTSLLCSQSPLWK